ncbi:lipase [Fomitiporia mediterranea MF3/22]|uniref:lipase n=1 Tax=Fomitiporia mediterranea (strain MF3/22) TaxID=694068 RepID=UPI000440811A|nr:lipase [Fomitiporia mediterranea MF3/22]EJC99967.1 lipase [Fomitiporia mediterranea MF3/22]
MAVASVLCLLSVLPGFVSAYPTSYYRYLRDGFTTLSSTQVASFKPYTNYAAVAYCEPSETLAWNCGAKCDANSNFKTTASGGNGGDTQFWYVGYDSSLDTVIVGHQGTDTSNFISILVDADFFLGDLDSDLFPGIGSSIKAHSGFAGSHARSAPSILAAVNRTLIEHPSASVTTTGHSLGAALALLDAVYLPLHLPPSTVVRTIGYGMPRVGNQAFADYVDAHVPPSISITTSTSDAGLARVNNKKDPVPILPGRGLGFHHPSGEVHIQEEGDAWVKCPGQDNTDQRCTIGTVPNIFEGDADDHDGPYDGVLMGCT